MFGSLSERFLFFIALLYVSTNRPGAWPIDASRFAQALAGNATALYNAAIQPFHLHNPSHVQTELSRAAVVCADSPSYKHKNDWPSAEFMLNKTLYNLKASPHFGARFVLRRRKLLANVERSFFLAASV
jgi:hypothetical protein